MALAILEQDGAEADAHHFRVDVGTSRYWAYAIGDPEATERVDGFTVLGDRSYSSPVYGPLPLHARGRTTLAIPRERFSRQHSAVQLLSFREERMRGPAVSEILRVSRTAARGDGLDAIQFAAAAASSPHDVVAFRAERAPVSTAMFLGALTGLISQIVPVLKPLFGGAPVPGGVGGVIERAAQPDNAKLLTDLIAKLVGQPAPVPPTPPVQAAVTPAPEAKQQAFDSHADVRLSNAHVAPALLAALPALMPLLQQVLTPETIKSLIETADPSKLIGAVTDSVKQIGQVALQGVKQELDHLERLNPGTATPELERLLAGMSLTPPRAHALVRSAARPLPRWRRSTSVHLRVAELRPLTVGGRSQVSFLAGREVRLPLAIETPRRLPRARLVVEVKEPETLRMLVKREADVPSSPTGPLPVDAVVPASDAAKLRPGRDYLVCASLSWRGRKGRLGTSITQLVSMVGPLTVDRVAPKTGAALPLNDVVEHRAFWHRIWQAELTPERRRIALEITYHYTVEPTRGATSQMETVLETDAEGRKETGSARSGLVISPSALDALLPELGAKRLDAEHLAALATPSFASRVAEAARTRVALQGRPGRSAAVWVFPEVKLHEISLLRARDVDENGQVTGFASEVAQLPLPVAAHVIGAVSE